MTLFVLLGWVVSGLALAQAAAGETDDLMDLSLEQLLGLEVTTFSRQAQPLARTPAAMFVITQTDIARSGARTVPDLLRMVPGVQVAQVDSSTWAVTARGSNGVFANKLLVLQDGRSLYSPLYSGVYWDTNDTDLDSIDRIEVIRGPGATMWGSNAVNGVINIITKNATDTSGSRATALAGTERVEGSASSNFQAGSANIRAFAKYFDRDGFDDDPSGSGKADDWDMLRAGVRADWGYSERGDLTFTGEVYDGEIGESVISPQIAPPYGNPAVQEDRDVKGAFAQLAWGLTLSDTSSLRVQTYYDHTEIDTVAPEETRDTFDIDMQHQFELGNRNNVIWGLGYRSSQDDTTGDFTIALIPEDRTQRIWSGFVQDEITLVADSLFLIAGTKVEKNSYSDSNLEWEPNIRLSWHVNDKHMLWTSVARSVRIPSRVELNGQINGNVVAPGAIDPMGNPNPFLVPLVATINGDDDLKSEDIVTYEIGYRGQLSDTIKTDISLFYSDYDDLRTLSTDAFGTTCQPSGTPAFPPIPGTCLGVGDAYASLPLNMENGGDADTFGVEVNTTWQASENLSFQGAYTYFYIDDDDLGAIASAGTDSPDHQVSLRSLWNVTSTTNLDLWFRWVSELDEQDINGYVTLDARAAWRPTEQLELSLVGRNLLEHDHEEFTAEFGAQTQVEIPREVYVEASFSF